MRPVVAAAVGLVVGTLVVAVNLATFDGDTAAVRSRTYVDLDHLDSDRFLDALYQGDGQAFAALAQDPTLSRPEAFRQGDAEAAYRAQRPLLGWLGWVASAGRAAAVPAALYALSVLSYGALAGAAARLAGPATGRAPLWVLAAPGAVVVLDWAGPECLGTAFALLALDAWRRGRPGWAAAALVPAALSRETFLLVAAVLAVDALASRRWGPAPWSGPRLRAAAWTGLPVAAYAAWLAVVVARIGAWPTAAGDGRLAAPLAGLVRAAGRWGDDDWQLAVGGAALVVAALVVRRGVVAYVAGAYLACSLVLGPLVWRRYEDFARVLLPMYACAVVALIIGLGARRRAAAAAGSSPPRRTPGPGPGSPAAVPAPPS
jgi:hypothetical protein